MSSFAIRVFFLVALSLVGGPTVRWHALLPSRAFAADGENDAVRAAKELLDGGATMIAAAAWPTATYNRATLGLPRVLSSTSIAVPMRFYCTSSWSGDEIWFDLQLVYTRGRGFTDLSVSDYHSVVPPFLTSQLTIGAIQQIANSGTTRAAPGTLAGLRDFDGARFGDPPLPSMKLETTGSGCGRPIRLYSRASDLTAEVAGYLPRSSQYLYSDTGLYGFSFRFDGTPAARALFEGLVSRFGWPQSAEPDDEAPTSIPGFYRSFYREWRAGSVAMAFSYSVGADRLGDESVRWQVMRADLSPCPTQTR